MTPGQALVKLAGLISTSDLPSGPLAEADECIEVLSDFIESGAGSD